MKDHKNITDQQVAHPAIELPERFARPEDAIQNTPQDTIDKGTPARTEEADLVNAEARKPRAAADFGNRAEQVWS
ncbi:MAG: hypothetical protein ACOH13_00150 [Flavobacteriales bacterium]